MAQPSRLVALAAELQQHIAELEHHHQHHDLSATTPGRSPPEQSQTLSPALAHASAISTAQELLNTLRDPRDLIVSQTLQSQQLVYYELIARLDLARRVPLSHDKDNDNDYKGITYAALATQTGIAEASLKRHLRYAITNGIFSETDSGLLTHSPASRIIAEDEDVRSFLSTLFTDIFPAHRRAVDALLVQGASRAVAGGGGGDGGVSAYELAFGETFWEVLQREPERAGNFAAMMRVFATSGDLRLGFLVEGFPWGELGGGGGEEGRESVVVDLGGSTGAAARALVERFPELKVVVQDLPETVALAETSHESRVSFMPHDMFEPQPVQGADVYLFRWVLHDWPDQECILILRALIPALKPGTSRVLVMDAVLRAPGSISIEMEKNTRIHDVAMHYLFQAHERSLQEWEDLFEAADSRFVFRGLQQPAGSRFAILEFVWEEEGNG